MISFIRKMMSIRLCVVLIGLLKSVSCQLYTNYDVYKLGDIPPFFNKVDFDTCNLTGHIHIPTLLSVPPPVYECTRYLCLLNAYNLLNNDISIDYVGLQTLLDNYVVKNQTAAAAVRRVSRHCIGGPLGGPCEADRLVHCIITTYFLGHLSTGLSMPARCRAPPPAGRRPHECCKVPPIFKEGDYQFCGFGEGDGPSGRGLPKAPPHHLYGGCPGVVYPRLACPRDMCVLNKYNLTTYDGKLEIEPTKRFMDNYAKENPTYKNIIEKTRDRCVLRIAPGPAYVCEAQKFIHCVTSNIIHSCPAWEDSSHCSAVRAYVEECRFYHRAYKYATF